MSAPQVSVARTPLSGRWVPPTQGAFPCNEEEACNIPVRPFTLGATQRHTRSRLCLSATHGALTLRQVSVMGAVRACVADRWVCVLSLTVT